MERSWRSGKRMTDAALFNNKHSMKLHNNDINNLLLIIGINFKIFNTFVY